MRKGLYWSQLILGIGIGLVLTALVWISINEFYPQLFQPTVQQTVSSLPQREIVYYEYPYFEFKTPELTLPELPEDKKVSDKKQVTEEDTEPLSDKTKQDKSTTKTIIVKQGVNLGLSVDSLISSLINGTEEKKVLKQSKEDKPKIDMLLRKETDISYEEKENEKDNKSNDTSEPEEELIELTVKPGEPAWQIASRLEDKGIIDRSDFIKVVDQMDLDKKLRVGTYKFKKDMNIFEVIAELMKVNY